MANALCFTPVNSLTSPGALNSVEHLNGKFNAGGLCSNLKSDFLGNKSGIRLAVLPFTHVGYTRKVKIVECKESRIGKHPIEVPSNVTLTLEGQSLKVKGPLGELSRSYPREVKLERLESGELKVSKAMETRRANQMHGLFSAATAVGSSSRLEI